MPVSVDEPDVVTCPAAPGHTTINYHGPVIHGSADGAQLAWSNSGSVNQTQNFNSDMDPPVGATH